MRLDGTQLLAMGKRSMRRKYIQISAESLEQAVKNQLRNFPRKNTAINAEAFNPETEITLECKIRDVSINGCKVQCAASDLLPDCFLLRPEGVHGLIAVEVKWREQNWLGLQFKLDENIENLP